MTHTSAGRFAPIIAALGGMLLGGFLIAGPAVAATTPEPEPVQLSLKPVDQPGSFFELSLEPGQTQEYAVELRNHGTTSIVARTYAADAYSITNGSLGAEDRDGAPSATTTWLSYPAEVLELEPGQADTRKFTITVPAGTTAGQYISSLVLENDTPVEGSGGVAVNQVIRQAVAVSIRVPGPLEPAFAFGTAGHKITAQHSVVGVELINTGNANLKPAGVMKIRDTAGMTVSEAPITMGSVYAHNETRVETTLASTLKPGEYTLDITLTDASTKATSTAEALAFTVTREEVNDAKSAAPAPLPEIFQADDPQIVLYLIGGVLIAALIAFLLVRRARARRRALAEGGRNSAPVAP